MRQIRIHIDTPLAEGAEVTLPEQAGEHVARVLRLGVGDAVVLFDGRGDDYAATLTGIAKRAVSARVEGRREPLPESPLRLTLAQGIARGEKMDLIVQKATELGVARIVPLVSQRTEVRLDAERADKRLAHWRAVVVSACEQSGRARLPQIDAPQTLETWLATLTGDGAARLALLPEGETAPRTLGGLPHHALLAVGPEGGFGERDVAALRAAGFAGLRLGPRILRTETAGLAALAALQALYGDF